MSRQRRDFGGREFDCVTLRPWDTYFWWVAMEDMPAASMILPEDWDKAKRRNLNPLHIKGKVGGANSVV